VIALSPLHEYSYFLAFESFFFIEKYKAYKRTATSAKMTYLRARVEERHFDFIRLSLIIKVKPILLILSSYISDSIRQVFDRYASAPVQQHDE
jgi:hypothetical protein